MINNKKALSTVVTTLIIILLVLVAIGIIWAVINNVVTEGSKNINYSVECIKVDVKATGVTCISGDVCDVTFTRGSQGNPIDGVKLVFSNAVDGFSSVLDSPGTIDTLATVTRTISSIGLTNVPDKVEVTAYFLDSQGIARPCTTYAFGF